MSRTLPLPAGEAMNEFRAEDVIDLTVAYDQ